MVYFETHCELYKATLEKRKRGLLNNFFNGHSLHNFSFTLPIGVRDSSEMN